MDPRSRWNGPGVLWRNRNAEVRHLLVELLSTYHCDRRKACQAPSECVKRTRKESIKSLQIDCF